MFFDRRSLLFLSCALGCGGDNDGSGDDSSDDALEQSAECSDYLDCVGIVDPGSIGGLIDSYGPSGSCWDDDDSADICTSSCVAAMTQLFLKYPTVEECSNGNGSNLFFGADTGWRYEATDCNGIKPYTMVGRFHGTSSWAFTIDLFDYVGGTVDCLIDPVTRVFACDPFYNEPFDYISVFTGEFEPDMTSGTGLNTITEWFGNEVNYYCEMDATPVP